MRSPLCFARSRFALHVCIDSVCDLLSCFWGLFVCACMLVLRVIVCAFAFVCCKVAIHITRVLILHARFGCVSLVCLCVLYDCFACGVVCVCFFDLQVCVSYYTCV